jgi:hypothetical protein
MRPLIVIGASDVMRTALEPYREVGHIEHHPTAQTAHYALADLRVTPEHPQVLSFEATRRPYGWAAHVAYGPLYYGPLMAAGTTGSARLAHTGHTLVLTWDVDPEPGKPRRVLDGQVAGEHPDTTPWQVAAAVSADYVVDLGRPVGLPFLIRLLEWKDGAHS